MGRKKQNRSQHMVRYIWLLIFILLFAGCNEGKEFLTPTPDKIVIDVTHKDISFNGEIIGEPIKDIEEDRLHSIAILPLEKKLRSMSPKPSTVHIHIDGLNSYKALTRTFVPTLFLGFKDIKIALGKNFKNIISPYLFNKEYDNNHPCRGPRGGLREILNVKAEAGMTADEKYQKRLKELEKDRQCAENYMELYFTYFNDKDSISFAVSLNEIGIIGTNKYTKFTNEKDLWNYIEELRSRKNLQNKLDKDEILFIAKEKTAINEIAPYLIHLSKMGYSIKFATMY